MLRRRDLEKQDSLIPATSACHIPCHFPWRLRHRRLKRAAMTRTSIERCIWIFIVALIATFIWTVAKVFTMLGWF
jgi:hypothetical protein